MHTRKLTLIAAMLAGLTLSAAAQAEMLPCELRYTQGISQFQAGDFVAAERMLEEATLLSPEPDAEDGGYTPYMYLAAVRYEMGDVAGAREALAQSRIYGVASETRAGRQLLEDYAGAIDSAPESAADLAQPQASPALNAKPALTDMDADLIRDRVLRRCALSDEIADNKLPWYFHYLLGLEYSELGDNTRALQAFQLGANMQERPSRSKRLYGMWYMDYLPYYQIALAHEQMGDWSDAKEALYVSLAVGEFEEGGRGWTEFVEMEGRLDRELRRQGDS